MCFPEFGPSGPKGPFGLGEPENGPRKTDPGEPGNRHPAVPDSRVTRKTDPMPGNGNRPSRTAG